VVREVREREGESGRGEGKREIERRWREGEEVGKEKEREEGSLKTEINKWT
jgi:hypothetical protein